MVLSVGWLGFCFEPGLALPEIRSSQLVVEEELDVGHSLQDVEESLIQACPVNSKDGLLISVGVSVQVVVTTGSLQTYLPVDIIILGLLIEATIRSRAVDHPAPHGNSGLKNGVEERGMPGIPDSVYPTLR